MDGCISNGWLQALGTHSFEKLLEAAASSPLGSPLPPTPILQGTCAATKAGGTDTLGH